MSQSIEQAADYRLGTPYALATAATSTRVALPADCAPTKGHVMFCAEGLDVWIRFGDDSVEVDEAATSTVVSEVITDAGDTVPHLHVPAGTEKQPKIPVGATHLAYISTGTTGILRFGSASGVGAVSG